MKEQEVSEFAAACVAAGAVVVTSGFALGGARRRKTIRELLEIRDAILGRTDPVAGAASPASPPSAGVDVKRIDALINHEITALETLGRTSTGWVKTAVLSLAVFVGVGLIGGVVVELVPSGAENTVRYIAAVALLLSALVVAVAAPYMLARAKWWSFAFVVASVFVAITAFLVLAVRVLEGTPYIEMVMNK